MAIGLNTGGYARGGQRFTHIGLPQYNRGGLPRSPGYNTGFRPPRVRRPVGQNTSLGRKFSGGPQQRHRVPGAPGGGTNTGPGTTPGTAPGGSSPSTPGPAPSPYDATYYQQLNQATFDANNRINAYNQQGAYAGIDLQNALANLAHQQPIDTLNTQEQANKQGLLFSGTLGNRIGELNRAYLQRQAADQQQFDRGQAARAAAVAALRGGLSLTQAALAAAAVERASTAAAKDPSLGAAPGAPAGGGRPGATNTGGRGGGRGGHRRHVVTNTGPYRHVVTNTGPYRHPGRNTGRHR